MSRIKRLTSIVLAFALLSALVPVQAFAYGANALMASSANIASGTWGTCPWELNSDGTLTVHPGQGKDVGMYSDSPWIGYAKSIKRIVFSEEDGQKVIAPEDCGKLLAVSWFSYDDDHMHWDSGFGASFYASNVESIDLSGLDTSHVESMYCMFSGCSSLTALDVSTLNTSHVTNMHFMFDECVRLKALDLSNFDTRNVETMNAMFNECYALQSVDVSTFDTSKVTDMEFMFSDCESLESVDISWFDMSSVTSTESMFQGCQSLKCQSLKAIDLSGLDFSNVTNMSYMFSAVVGVTKLDLTGFGSAVVDMEHAFASCSSLRELQIGPDLLLKENCGLREGSWKNKESGKALSTADLIAASSQGKSGGVWQYVKKANTMAAYVKKWAFSVKAKKLKKKAQKVSRPVDVYNEEGSVSFKNVSTAKKAKKFKVNAKTGTVTVPKKTKKGTYKIKVEVTATGDNDYKSASKKVTVKIKVK